MIPNLNVNYLTKYIVPTDYCNVSPNLHDPAMFLPALGCCDMSSSTLMMLQGVLSHSQDGAMCPLPRSGYCTSKPRKLTNSKSYQLSSPLPLQVLEVVHHQPPPPVEEVVHQPPHWQDVHYFDVIPTLGQAAEQVEPHQDGHPRQAAAPILILSEKSSPLPQPHTLAEVYT